MNINTRDMPFINFNGQEMQWIKFNNVVVYEAWKNLIANGVPPLTLLNCKGVDLIDYKIYGESVQDGTPTPDNPVEIQSVGDKTKNLFDVSKSSGFESKYGMLTSIIDGNVITVECSVPSRIGYLELGTFEAGNYYISANFITGIAYVRVVLNDKIISSEDYTIRNGKGIVIELLQDTHIRLSGSFSNNNISKMSDIQIVKSNIPTAYEPYGYKIPVKVSGTNIFDGLLQEGDYGTGTNRISSVNYIPVKPNTTYRFSRNNERVYMYDEAKTQLSRVDTGNSGNKITTTEDTRYIRVVWFGTEDTTQTIWINEGTELLDYEPYVAPITTNIYLDEPLRKIGDYADYIDFENQKVVRNIEEIDSTGTLPLEESLQVLSTPTEETIELPNIPTHKGTTILSVDTTIQPSNLEVVYKGKEVK